nr:DEAD/DEAH box helicase [Candidatus Sigynarchaeota archaeon]
TAAFALPILHNLANQQSTAPRTNEKSKKSPKREIRVLVLAPTRELAIQTGEFFTEYSQFSKLTNTVIYGGVGQNPQVEALQRGIDILTATPGRLLDLMNQGFVHLDHVEVLVLDEGDRMLDMGFIHDVRRIVNSVPAKRQTMLFSATIPREIIELASSILHDPANISVTPEQPTVEAITQFVYFVAKKKKQQLLTHLLKDKAIIRALVFTRTKHGANKVVKLLGRDGIIAEPIHGNKSQTARQKALEDFREGSTRVLVATDVASRGIDVEEISHVIQFDLPTEPETYVHRIGRTGRAGLAGIALAFCDDDERPMLKEIERLIRKHVPVVADHPFKE